MASNPELVELSDPLEILTDPFGSFPLSDATIILGTEAEASSPVLPHTNIRTTTTTHHGAPPPGL